MIIQKIWNGKRRNAIGYLKDQSLIICIFFVDNLNEFYFRDEWLEQIRTNQGNLLPIDEIEKIKAWFEYLFNEQNPAASTDADCATRNI